MIISKEIRSDQQFYYICGHCSYNNNLWQYYLYSFKEIKKCYFCCKKDSCTILVKGELFANQSRH